MDDDNQVTLQSQDNIDFQIEVKVAKQSETIKNLIEDAGTTNIISLPNIDGKILKVIVEIMTILSSNRPERFNEARAILNSKDRDLMISIIIATNYIDHKWLLTNAVKIVASQLYKSGEYTDAKLESFRKTKDIYQNVDENKLKCEKINVDLGKHINRDICSLITNAFPTVQIACGTHHTMVVTKDGNLYGTGLNKYGQLGNGKSGEEERERSFVKIDVMGKKVSKVACGMYHTMAITEDGMLYGTGLDFNGQLGRSKPINLGEFDEVEELSKLIKDSHPEITNEDLKK